MASHQVLPFQTHRIDDPRAPVWKKKRSPALGQRLSGPLPRNDTVRSTEYGLEREPIDLPRDTVRSRLETRSDACQPLRLLVPSRSLCLGTKLTSGLMGRTIGRRLRHYMTSVKWESRRNCSLNRHTSSARQEKQRHPVDRPLNCSLHILIPISHFADEQ